MVETEENILSLSKCGSPTLDTNLVVYGECTQFYTIEISVVNRKLIDCFHDSEK